MYGNPFYSQQRYQPMQMANQPITTPTPYIPPMPQPPSQVGLLGKSVDSFDVVKAMDIPLDGSVSYFPLTDGSAIITKQLQSDGTSKTVVYKPIREEKKEEKNYVTFSDLEDAISKIDNSSFEEELEEIKKQMKELKGKLKIKEN